MTQPPCEPIVATIQQITQQLATINDQLHTLEVEGMNQQHPWRYIVLQRQVDRLIKKKYVIQGTWGRAMNELAFCRSAQPSPHRPLAPQSPQKSSTQTLADAPEKGGPAIHATDLVQATLRAWEERNARALASYLSDDVICKQIFPQPIGKAQLIAFMQAITTAFANWSFNGHVLDQEKQAERSWSILFVTAVTGTQTGDLVLPSLPVIPATGTSITLPYRHLRFLVTNNTITMITADFSPSGIEEVLAQLGMQLP